MEQSAINQRLNLVVDTFEGGKKAAFARKVGMSPQGVQEILAGRKGAPSFKVLVKILESYPQVCSDWLVLGKGPMLYGVSDAEKGNLDYTGEPPLESTRNNIIVPIVNINKFLYGNRKDGYASVYDSMPDEVLSLPASMLKAGLHQAFPIQNSDMEPTFYKDDLIIATQIQDVDWSAFPKESVTPAVRDSFPVCVIEVTSENITSIECGRCCVDLSKKILYSFCDNQFNSKGIPLTDIRSIWKFDGLFSSKSLNPAINYLDHITMLRYELELAKKNTESYIRLKHRLREMILEKGTTIRTLGQEIDDYRQDETVRKYYLKEVSQTDSEERYFLQLMNIIQKLIIELNQR